MVCVEFREASGAAVFFQKLAPSVKNEDFLDEGFPKAAIAEHYFIDSWDERKPLHEGRREDTYPVSLRRTL